MYFLTYSFFIYRISRFPSKSNFPLVLFCTFPVSYVASSFSVMCSPVLSSIEPSSFRLREQFLLLYVIRCHPPFSLALLDSSSPSPSAPPALSLCSVCSLPLPLLTCPLAGRGGQPTSRAGRARTRGARLAPELSRIQLRAGHAANPETALDQTHQPTAPIHPRPAPPRLARAVFLAFCTLHVVSRPRAEGSMLVGRRACIIAAQLVASAYSARVS